MMYICYNKIVMYVVPVSIEIQQVFRIEKTQPSMLVRHSKQLSVSQLQHVASFLKESVREGWGQLTRNLDKEKTPPFSQSISVCVCECMFVWWWWCGVMKHLKLQFLNLFWLIFIKLFFTCT